MKSRVRGAAVVLFISLLAGSGLFIARSEPAILKPSHPSVVDFRKARFVDLTHSFDAQTLYWPTAPSGFQLKELSRGRAGGGFYYSANSFCAPEHGGTHVDAPSHFAENGRSLDRLPVEQLMGPGIVVDVSREAEADPDYRLRLADLNVWEAKNGPIPEAAIILLRTGWGPRWPERRRYLGDDAPGDASHLHFPSFGEEAARFLVDRRKAAALGVDTASVDHGPSKDFLVHQVLASANVPGLENVARLEDLPPRGAWIIALPMKIAGGSGGPVRIVAALPQK